MLFRLLDRKGIISKQKLLERMKRVQAAFNAGSKTFFALKRGIKT